MFTFSKRRNRRSKMMLSWKEKKSKMMQDMRLNSGSNYNLGDESSRSRKLEVIYEAKGIKDKYLAQMEGNPEETFAPVDLSKFSVMSASPNHRRKKKSRPAFKPLNLSKIAKLNPHPGDQTKLKKLKKIVKFTGNVHFVQRDMERAEHRRQTVKFMGVLYPSGPLEVKGMKAVGREWVWWLFWDFIVMVVFVRDVLDVCYKYSFYWDKPAEDNMWYSTERIFIIVSVVSGIEIVLNFIRSPKATKGKVLLVDNSIEYLCGWFILDVLASAPLFLLSINFLFLRLIKFRQIFRTPFSMKDSIIGILDNPCFTGIKASRIHIPPILGQFGSLIMICVAILILSTLGIVLLQFRFVMDIYTRSADSSKAFLGALTYLLTTITTVGYGGEFIPVLLRNKAASLAYFIGGVMFYGYALRQVIFFIQKTRSYVQMKLQRQEDLDAWLVNKERGIMTNSKYGDVNEKIQKNFSFIWEWDIANMFDHEFMWMIAPSCRKEILEQTLYDLIKKFKTFFSIYDYDDAVILSQKLRPRLFVKGQVVAEKGQFPYGFYFILEGELELCHKNDGNISIMKYSALDFFGENLVLDENYNRTYRVRSKDLKCLFLSYDDFYTLTVNCDSKCLWKLKSIALFKRTALMVEDSKFDDFISKVLVKCIKTETGKVTRKSSACIDIIGMQDVRPESANSVMDYIKNKIKGTVNLKKLVELNVRLKSRRNGFIFPISGSFIINPEAIQPMKEPEPEIMFPSIKKVPFTLREKNLEKLSSDHVITTSGRLDSAMLEERMTKAETEPRSFMHNASKFLNTLPSALEPINETEGVEELSFLADEKESPTDYGRIMVTAANEEINQNEAEFKSYQILESVVSDQDDDENEECKVQEPTNPLKKYQHAHQLNPLVMNLKSDFAIGSGSCNVSSIGQDFFIQEEVRMEDGNSPQNSIEKRSFVSSFTDSQDEMSEMDLILSKRKRIVSWTSDWNKKNYEKLFEDLVKDDIEFVYQGKDNFNRGAGQEGEDLTQLPSEEDIESFLESNLRSSVQTSQTTNVICLDDSSDDEYYHHDKSSDEFSEEYPIENYTPKRSTLFEQKNYKLKVEALIRSQEERVIMIENNINRLKRKALKYNRGMHRKFMSFIDKREGGDEKKKSINMQKSLRENMTLPGSTTLK